MSAYDLLFRGVFVRMDPERAHHLAFDVIRMLGAPVLRGVVRAWSKPDPSLAVETLGLRFDSPFGVAAGFDKDALAVAGLGALGFGHVEVGTLTPVSQPGNEQPRMARLVADRAVVNRMGFNNGGADAAAGRLAALRRRRRRPVIGVNIGKNKLTPVEDAADDYERAARVLAPYADYLVVNVSSPNTPGLRGLQELDSLEPVLRRTLDAAGAVPLLVKIAPDLTDEEVERIAGLAVRVGLAGVIATNTTIARDELGLRSSSAMIEAAGGGGLSGAPLAARSLEVLRVIRRTVPAELCVISVGGVETAADVQERLDAGATLVQGYTGFIYRGPAWAREINRGLRKLRAA
ncbi:quinone-dependent dihydroorotate dehydrogenase [Agromyces seonyuensis]|uniref:Dihydroorotate dehydrogenase (quinone) n=1 Tax=Agromyces seonyuensis TaxID=2662446 RepID=A0A6I4NWW7_9MICO|nr:quinone-dependent dihydroorotate dehydrogenase [Agromyces seonyuensis]MWB98671.1 quinone-dependent dihydroorotate dehydrogenase [Agromyces seonyuensis]